MDIKYIFIKNEYTQPSDYAKSHQMVGTEENIANYNIVKNGNREKISDYADEQGNLMTWKEIEENGGKITPRKDLQAFKDIKPGDMAVLIDKTDNKVSLIKFISCFIEQPERTKNKKSPRGYVEFRVENFFGNYLNLNKELKNEKLKTKYTQGFTLASLQIDEFKNIKNNIEDKIKNINIRV